MARTCHWPFVIVCAMFVSPAHGHVRSESYSLWQLDGAVLGVRFVVPARELTHLPATPRASAGDLLAAHLAGRIRATSSAGDCVLQTGPVGVSAGSGLVAAEATWRCDGPPTVLELAALQDLAPEHTHVATVLGLGGYQQGVFAAGTRRWELGQRPPDDASTAWRAVLKRHLAAGIDHIATGWDHLAFLLALLLVCARPRELVLAVTGFTLGHSTSLALAVTGLVEPVSPAVEASIGLSIVLVAAERVVARRRSATGLASAFGLVLLSLAAVEFARPGMLGPAMLLGIAVFAPCYLLLARGHAGAAGLRFALPALFGLVHGLGFAGGLLEADLTPDVLVPALLGFNLGVEVGQLAVVVLVTGAWLVLRRIAGRAPVDATAEIITAGVAGLGSFWFVDRAYGPFLAF